MIVDIPTIEYVLTKRARTRECPLCGGYPTISASRNELSRTHIFSSRCHGATKSIAMPDRQLQMRGREGELLEKLIRELEFKPRLKLTLICSKQALRRRRR